MGHFSDFTYLQHGVGISFLFLYFIWSLWRSDRFGALSPHRIARFELKSIVCLLTLIAFPLDFYYQWTEVRITYAEGFIINPADGKLYVKPQSLWTLEDRKTITVTDYIFDLAVSMQASILFLLQCFWNYLSNSITKKSFMSSMEWKAYLIWAGVTLVLMPILQFAFSYNPLYAEVFPQMVYGIEVLAVSALGFLSHIRFNRLINGYEVTKRQLKNDIIVSKLTYFREMNAGLSACLLIVSVMVLMLCIDGLTPQKTLNSSKEITDAAICISNTAGLIVWYILISIFFPSRTYTTSSNTNSSSGLDDNSGIQMNPVKANNYAYQNHTPASQAIAYVPPTSQAKSFPGIVKTVTVEVEDGSNDDGSNEDGSNVTPLPNEDMTSLRNGSHHLV